MLCATRASLKGACAGKVRTTRASRLCRKRWRPGEPWHHSASPDPPHGISQAGGGGLWQANWSSGKVCAVSAACARLRNGQEWLEPQGGHWARLPCAARRRTRHRCTALSRSDGRSAPWGCCGAGGRVTRLSRTSSNSMARSSDAASSGSGLPPMRIGIHCSASLDSSNCSHCSCTASVISLPKPLRPSSSLRPSFAISAASSSSSDASASSSGTLVGTRSSSSSSLALSMRASSPAAASS
mmetsp:Transcript_6481/g.12291  ORF Transcript_6481/g.12291 Transcript_6481/m.12291 type:complete len:241 (+) Transcript_6481:1572-2294(+)